MDSGTSDIYKQDLLKEFFKIMQKTPHQMQITFRTLHSKFQKKIFQIIIFLTFSFGFRLHLLRRFQKGITLGVLSHISYFGRVVGVARMGRCG